MFITILLFILVLIWLVLGVWRNALTNYRPWSKEKPQRLIEVAWHYKNPINFLFLFNSGLTIIVLFDYFLIFGFWLALLYSLLGILVGMLAISNPKISKYIQKTTSTLVFKYSKNLKFFERFLQFLQNVLKKFQSDQPYFSSPTELFDFIKFHQSQFLSLAKKEQKQILQLLSIEDVSIISLTIPLKKAQMINSDEKIGTLLLQDIHDSSYGSFAVYDGKPTQPIGVLDQGVAMQNAKRHVKVKSIIDERIVYLPHDASLKKALVTFAETSSPLSVIIDDRNKPVGILYVQDIIRELFED